MNGIIIDIAINLIALSIASFMICNSPNPSKARDMNLVMIGWSGVLGLIATTRLIIEIWKTIS